MLLSSGGLWSDYINRELFKGKSRENENVPMDCWGNRYLLSGNKLIPNIVSLIHCTTIINRKEQNLNFHEL